MSFCAGGRRTKVSVASGGVSVGEEEGTSDSDPPLGGVSTVVPGGSAPSSVLELS